MPDGREVGVWGAGHRGGRRSVEPGEYKEPRPWRKDKLGSFPSLSQTLHPSRLQGGQHRWEGGFSPWREGGFRRKVWGMKHAWWVLAGGWMISNLVAGDLQPGRQQSQEFLRVTARTNRLGYLLYLPANYEVDRAAKFPLVLFLHGAGERGTDLSRVAAHGPPRQVREGRPFPFILVSPQCPANQVWDDETLLALLDQLGLTLRVDSKRVYVTGLSMGGYGTWSLAQRAPRRFAAVAPICGGGEGIRALLSPDGGALRALGVWAFHGGRDNVVPPSETERMVSIFKRLGVGDVSVTVYPEDGHDAWTHAYNEPEFYTWLLKHHR